MDATKDLSSEQNLGYLLYIADCITQFDRDYNKPFQASLNEPVSRMECHASFLPLLTY